MPKKTILVLNGPNLNLLGTREPDVYGDLTLADVTAALDARARELDVELVHVQSNHEGELVDRLQEAPARFDAVVYNPAAHTHYAWALRDAVAAIPTPVVEVHLTDITAREPFRALDVFDGVVSARFMGEGVGSYLAALDHAAAL